VCQGSVHAQVRGTKCCSGLSEVEGVGVSGERARTGARYEVLQRAQRGGGCGCVRGRVLEHPHVELRLTLAARAVLQRLVETAAVVDQRRGAGVVQPVPSHLALPHASHAHAMLAKRRSRHTLRRAKVLGTHLVFTLSIPRHRGSDAAWRGAKLWSSEEHTGGVTLVAPGSLQGVPPSCCGRRVAVWRVFEPTIRVWRSGNDAQAACEPDGGGSGGLPVHPLRLHSHRTSPAQALLTILARHAEPNA
jgi:hypothetical protein